MANGDIGFRLHAVDPCGARRGEFTTRHGTVQTPAFMPVGTAGFVRSTTPRDIAETGAQVLLANTYHLSLGERLATVRRSGGLHRFMGWDQTILTDSGGFQVFSLPNRTITEEGVSFSYEDEEKPLFLSPERSMEIQRELGADIVMAFDECVEFPTAPEYMSQAVERTTRWARRCRKVALQDHQFLFGIVQGGVYPELRRRSAEEITAVDFDGFAIGGVSVGEGLELLKKIVSFTAPLLPSDRPRYLMGVGLPEDILASVQRGMDMFDCVIPTRYARYGTLFTRTGKMRIMDKTFYKDKYPVDTRCGCYTCRTYSRMVLRYLFFTRDPLAEALATIHNVTFYQDLMRDLRCAIEAKRFSEFSAEWLGIYSGDSRKAGKSKGKSG
ncbi:MAG: tRNA guanosine(34) transglycosylase Tgt [Desulfobacterales bacterium]|nr:tRNA guanosine(34) transglycosylase Tgt [Desulfobacterales bacterium]MDD3951020.1 tRNA guanosine(34) transglycosylase Tgt [Desulfobacterales bacterium]MDD4463395.1 tRNA guanosine(34) transglycosylase Tgt [Desulfobacterales bacterium]MDY0378038.1 tRNA guanosine(34) transglycosylase Tgt [Desulfobacterales bacterium]